MLKELKLVFSKISDELTIQEYFEIRNIKVSFSFVAIITGFLMIVIPVLFFVIKYTVGAIATSMGVVFSIFSLLLILKRRFKFGCALMIVFLELCILFVYLNAFILNPDPATVPYIVITLISFSIIILIPSGILIDKLFPILFGSLYGVAVLVMMKMSGMEMLIARIPLVGASYGIASVLIFYITSIQDQLLKKAITESENAVKSLAEIRSMMSNMRTFKTDLDQSQSSISDELEKISLIFNKNSEVFDSMFQVYDNLNSEMNNTRANLDLFIASIFNITNQLDSQKRIVDSSHASQEEMFKAIGDITGNARKADDINTRLNEIADLGRNQLTESIKTIEDLGEYQKRLLDIVNVLKTVTQDTNVLALNASIEASHAGKVGRGFAIVAKEIKNLADSSGKHTKDISLLIEEMNAKIGASVALIRSVGGLLLEITDNVKVSYESVSSITSSMEDFTERSGQMLEEIKQLVMITSGIAADAGKGNAVSAEFLSAFKSFEGFFDRFNDTVKDLKGYAEQSIEIMKNVSVIKQENEIINSNMNDLLGGSASTQKTAVPEQQTIRIVPPVETAGETLGANIQ